MATEWITVRHEKTGHKHRIPNRQHLLDDWAKRGWKPVKETENQPAVSGKSKE